MDEKETKPIVIQVSGAKPGEVLRDVDIERGVTVADVLRGLDLVGYALSPKGAATKIPDDAVLWPIVEDGDLLRATADATMG